MVPETPSSREARKSLIINEEGVFGRHRSSATQFGEKLELDLLNLRQSFPLAG
jgi:hypothetical protein